MSATDSLSAAQGWQTEAERQSALLAAIHGRQQGLTASWLSPLGPAGDRASLRAYQGQAGATALRALQAVYPVLAQVVGEEGIAMLAHGLWQAEPPLRGDLACWGAGLADLIDSRPEFAELPYLADLARLEWQIHDTLRAADGRPEVAGLQLLAEHEPGRLGLRFQPGCALLRSAYPVGTVWDLHQPTGPQVPALSDEDRLAPARRALELGLGENLLVHRRGWQLALSRLGGDEADFTGDLLAGASLGGALERQDPALFEPWLLQALQQSWLAEVHLLDAGPPNPIIHR